MRRKIEKVFALSMVLAIATMITGCGSKIGDIKLDAGQTGIYVTEDNEINYSVCEKFDKDYYDKDELEKAIDNEVSDYNNSGKASVKDAAKVEDFSVSDDKATAIISFETAYDFNTYAKEYNKEDMDKFFVGTVADNSLCKIKGDFVSADKRVKKTAEDIKQNNKYNIIIISYQTKVQVESEVKYISTNCTINKDGVVTTAKDETSYIVY